MAEDGYLSLPTVYEIIKKICDKKTDVDILGSKKGRKKEMFSEAKSKLSELLLRDASYNQKELSEELRKINIYKTQPTISRLLKNMEYTKKRLVKIPEERNSPRNIDSRQSYTREIEFMNDDNLVFLDETGINLNQSRNYGYSPKNCKAVKIVKNSRGKNISCMVAIKKPGIIAFEVKDGSFTGESFIDFINNKLSLHFQNNNDTLIMDN
ncbi:hypothetical protein DMUE_5331 [Dictyocoela muelleri]|nr:hypothetical protein DMUE_5331 [Dictyocoela muelleri]